MINLPGIRDEAIRNNLAMTARSLREEAGLTQRALGKRLKKPQSWVYNCEAANRRVDVSEFVAWARACDVDPEAAFARFLELT